MPPSAGLRHRRERRVRSTGTTPTTTSTVFITKEDSKITADSLSVTPSGAMVPPAPEEISAEEPRPQTKNGSRLWLFITLPSGVICFFLGKAVTDAINAHDSSRATLLAILMVAALVVCVLTYHRYNRTTETSSS